MADIVRSAQGEVVAAASAERASYVQNRLLEINREVADKYLENGLLLKEIRDNAYYREWGFSSFDLAIETMRGRGQLDYGKRSAWYFIAVVEMIERLGLPADSVQSLGIT